MRQRHFIIHLPLLLVLGLAGCGGGSSGNADNGAMDASFTSFVKDEFAITASTDRPATVNKREFRFEDLENPDAYDDIL